MQVEVQESESEQEMFKEEKSEDELRFEQDPEELKKAMNKSKNIVYNELLATDKVPESLDDHIKRL